jgi:hypothetical protein
VSKREENRQVIHKICTCRRPIYVDQCAGCLQQICRCGGVQRFTPSAPPRSKEE